MTIILGILIAIVVIVRIAYIIDSMFTYDFLVGLIPVVHVVGALSGKLSIIPVYVALIWILKSNGNLPNKRLRVSTGWTIASYILCIIPSSLLFMLFGNKADEFIITFYIGFISLAFILWKPIRAPFFVMVNILLLGLVVYKLDNSVGDMGDICVDSPDSSNIAIDNSDIEYMNNSSDPISLSNISDGIDTLQQNVAIHSFLPNVHNFIIDPSPFLGNDILSSDTIVLTDASGGQTMSLRNGIIFDGNSQIIGSYEYNQEINRTTFFDGNHRIAYSVDSDGRYFDSNNQVVGSARDSGEITTVCDKYQQPLYQIHTGTNSVYDKYGQLIGTIRKA